MKRPLRTKSGGQSLVEFALLLPVLAMIAFLLLDLGRGVYYYSVVYNAVREGARYGIVHPTDGSGVEAAVRNLTVGLDQADLTVDYWMPFPVTTGSTLWVEATYRFRPVTPLADLFIPSGFIDLYSKSTMFIEK